MIKLCHCHEHGVSQGQHLSTCSEQPLPPPEVLAMATAGVEKYGTAAVIEPTEDGGWMVSYPDVD